MSLVLSHTHPWDLSLPEARLLQDKLRGKVKVQPLDLGAVKTVAGVDAGYHGGDMRAAVAVLDFKTQELVEQVTFQMPVSFPYVPGLLSFREAPAILGALSRLNPLPDVLIVDGHGLAHPRRFGLACHLGVLLDIPALGCAKSVFVGEVAPLGDTVGNTSQLSLQGELLGFALRTRERVKPVYVSVGHRIDLPSAVQIILSCTRGYRLPEPIRMAHRLASKIRV